MYNQSGIDNGMMKSQQMMIREAPVEMEESKVGVEEFSEVSSHRMEDNYIGLPDLAVENAAKHKDEQNIIDQF